MHKVTLHLFTGTIEYDESSSSMPTNGVLQPEWSDSSTSDGNNNNIGAEPEPQGDDNGSSCVSAFSSTVVALLLCIVAY